MRKENQHLTEWATASSGISLAVAAVLSLTAPLQVVSLWLSSFPGLIPLCHLTGAPLYLLSPVFSRLPIPKPFQTNETKIPLTTELRSLFLLPTVPWGLYFHTHRKIL